jgi:hypothetical protein
MTQEGGLVEYALKDGSKSFIAAGEIDHVTRWEDEEIGGIHTKSVEVIKVVDASRVIEQWSRLK